ncbi:MAG: adenylyltransferase/cytidyltransferase family protein [Candidatus Spechtbacterales bacterium]
MKHTRVLAFGTFDLLHEGQINYLQQAKALGDELVVLVACDQAVERVKHRPAVHSQEERLAAVAKLPFVDKAVLGKPVARKEDYLRPIQEHAPDIICLGYDQALDISEWLEGRVADMLPATRIVRAKAYHPEVYKTSLLRTAHGRE